MVFALERVIDASPEEAWAVIADVGDYHRLAAGLSRVEVVRGDGEGMQRRCYDRRGRGWSETCTLWEEGRRYSFSVDTATFPAPLRQLFRRFDGTWLVEPEVAGSRIAARFHVEPRFGPFGVLAVRMMRREAEKQLIDLLDRWQGEVRARGEGQRVSAFTAST